MSNTKLPYTACIITARTPYDTYRSARIVLNEQNAAMVETILANVHAQLQVKLPISDDEVVVLPTELLQRTAFSVRYIA